MLIEIWSPVFKKSGIVRDPIKFKPGLNVIQGSETGSNSIGKSSALLAIDFAFGGNTYLESDGVKHLGNHTICFSFKFDKRYYFSRNTESPEDIHLCDEKYNETEISYNKKEFSEFLKEKYAFEETNLSFRQLISTFFRIYGKDNRNENQP